MKASRQGQSSGARKVRTPERLTRRAGMAMKRVRTVRPVFEQADRRDRRHVGHGRLLDGRGGRRGLQLRVMPPRSARWPVIGWRPHRGHRGQPGGSGLLAGGRRRWGLRLRRRPVLRFAARLRDPSERTSRRHVAAARRRPLLARFRRRWGLRLRRRPVLRFGGWVTPGIADRRGGRHAESAAAIG